MKIEKPYTLEEIAAIINGKIVGDPAHLVTGIKEIHMVVSGDLVFVDHPKYYEKALKSAATTILIDQEVECPDGKALIISATPFDDFNRLTRHFSPFAPQKEPIGIDSEIEESAIIYPNVFIGNQVKIAANVILQAGCFVGDNCEIGEGSVIYPNVTIYHGSKIHIEHKHKL